MMDQADCTAWTAGDPAAIAYHDTRWGRPVHDDRELFAMLCLEGQQAGLSWRTILKKEAAIRAAFQNFDVDAVAAYGPEEIDALMQNADIVRNRLKLQSVVNNARAYKALLASGDYASFDAYIWHFTGGRQIIHHPKTMADIPATDDLARSISRDLKKRGFRFVGPMIVYAYMQAVGIYEDHLENCPFKVKEERQM